MARQILFNALGMALGLGALAAVSACRVTPPAAAAADVPAPAATVTDPAAFDAFIATRPTPDAFRARYPGLRLVLPGQTSSRELRLDHSRYFAELDEQQRIVGGRFQ